MSRPFGDAPVGRILHGPDGAMSAMLGAAYRAAFDGRAGEFSDAAWAAAAKMFVAYAGARSASGRADSPSPSNRGPRTAGRNA